MNWKPNQKMACYILLAALTNFMQAAVGLTRETRLGYDWWDWLVFLGPIVLSMLNAWRAFVDQSKSRQEAEVLNSGPVPIKTAPPVDPPKP